MADRQTALVTGGSRGIGAAVAVGLAHDGFDILLNYRGNSTAAEATADLVRQAGVNCRLMPFDVADMQQVQEALESLGKDETPFAVINNAGITRDNLLVWMEPDDWKTVLSVHLDGFFNVTKTLIGRMIRKRKGRIINMVSVSGLTGVAGQVNYSAAKAGLIGATRSLAAEVAKRNILVNAVAPGFIQTDMTEHLDAEAVLPHIPAGRLGTAEDVAHCARFLCSPAASYITGQVISVNGGLYL